MRVPDQMCVFLLLFHSFDRSKMVLCAEHVCLPCTNTDAPACCSSCVHVSICHGRRMNDVSQRVVRMCTQYSISSVTTDRYAEACLYALNNTIYFHIHSWVERGIFKQKLYYSLIEFQPKARFEYSNGFMHWLCLR